MFKVKFLLVFLIVAGLGYLNYKKEYLEINYVMSQCVRDWAEVYYPNTEALVIMCNTTKWDAESIH